MINTLPDGYKIVTNNYGFRFVQIPNGKLVPNQGTRTKGKDSSDQEIIDDFFIWYKREVLK